MHALPTAVATLTAVVLARPLRSALERAGATRTNYRDRPLAFPFGLLIPGAAGVALAPLAAVSLLTGGVFHAETVPALLLCAGVVVLGLLDDVYGARRGPRAPRGLRGHATALLAGAPSTGAAKAAGTLALAFACAALLHLEGAHLLLAAGVLLLGPHVFNLLDLRPGRALKALLLALCAASLAAREVRPLWTVGLLAAPAAVAGAVDLRERALLGDTGASAMGALAGLAAVLALAPAGLALVLAGLGLATVYGELRSISTLVETTPGLRELDSLGRPS
ncbi:MAG TPA: hypothetical protein VFW29_00720 [Solirubrobacteraceae bacterium]|nr:hypothetical protein [Solirubrobacteraceae bacterium]